MSRWWWWFVAAWAAAVFVVAALAYHDYQLDKQRDDLDDFYCQLDDSC